MSGVPMDHTHSVLSILSISQHLLDGISNPCTSISPYFVVCRVCASCVRLQQPWRAGETEAGGVPFRGHWL